MVALSLGTGLAVSALVFTGGFAFIDFVSTNPAVRQAAGEFLVFAALTPLIGAAAFAFDGIYMGATWTRAMRNLMLISLALYLCTFFVARGWSNAGPMDGVPRLPRLARHRPGAALSAAGAGRIRAELRAFSSEVGTDSREENA